MVSVSNLNGQTYFKSANPTPRAINMSSSKLWAEPQRTGITLSIELTLLCYTSHFWICSCKFSRSSLRNLMKSQKKSPFETKRACTIEDSKKNEMRNVPKSFIGRHHKSNVHSHRPSWPRFSVTKKYHAKKNEMCNRTRDQSVKIYVCKFASKQIFDAIILMQN